jgi:predicted nucleotidyltransferase
MERQTTGFEEGTLSPAEWQTRHPDPRVRESLQKRWRGLHEELRRLTSRLVEIGAERILLFGSIAKGDATPHSDVDLLAVIPTDLPFVQRMEHFYRLLQPRNADVLIYTPEEFDQGLGMTKTVLAEGTTLYERPENGEPALAPAG